MKKLIYIMLLVLMLSGCDNRINEENRLNIVTSNFPAYDFTRQIAGGLANITLLLPPGSESHSFEPTPKDIINIQESDLLICNGGKSETWLEYLTDTADVQSVIQMTAYGANIPEEQDYDEHVWCSPVNAMAITQAIYEEICILDPENADTYTKNRDAFMNELKVLDNTFRSIVDSSKNKTIIFADRFPVRHFTEEYGLKYYSAFPGCSAEAEPSAATITELIEKINSVNLKGVFYIEFSNQKIADIVCEETGCEKLLFHSCHNISKDDFKSGATYVSVMKQNAENLRKVLK